MAFWGFLLIFIFAFGAVNVRAQKPRSDASSQPQCESVPASGDNIGTLACPNDDSMRFQYTGAPQVYSVDATTCNLPQPKVAEGEELPPPVERENCFFSVSACGAQGDSYGGRGGYIEATIMVAPGATLYVYVGGWGKTFNGGGYGGKAGRLSINGGGGTDVRLENGGPTGSTNLESRLVVAGGGGAGGNCRPSCPGGAGGGFTGQKGQFPNPGGRNQVPNGRGGGQADGGSAGSGLGSGKEAGMGAFGKGGSRAGGGAGGGGWYGGGAGFVCGGGGSSWSKGVISANIQGDARCRGNGALFITPLDIKEMPPSLEPTPSPTHPTYEPTAPTPRPSRVKRLRSPTE